MNVYAEYFRLPWICRLEGGAGRGDYDRNNGDDTTSLGGGDDLMGHFHSTDGGGVVQSPNRDVSLPLI